MRKRPRHLLLFIYICIMEFITEYTPAAIKVAFFYYLLIYPMIHKSVIGSQVIPMNDVQDRSNRLWHMFFSANDVIILFLFSIFVGWILIPVGLLMRLSVFPLALNVLRGMEPSHYGGNPVDKAMVWLLSSNGFYALRLSLFIISSIYVLFSILA